ncbi:hypothetical protein [Tepidimonas sp.]|uniref:hypothetical protein n=1 Tax=Tepidimonas sp. TaxID=2002775 RepID=UPI002FDFEDEE
MVRISSLVTRAALALWLAVATLSVQAQELVSVRVPTAHLRAGPGTDSDVRWQLRQG